MSAPAKPVKWMGRSRADLKGFPAAVQRAIGVALRRAQQGGKHPAAKPLTGFGGGSVLEIADDDDGDTYRAVYTVRFREAVYVLHCFQKKSTRGIATPQREIAAIERRLAQAQAAHDAWQQQQAQGGQP